VDQRVAALEAVEPKLPRDRGLHSLPLQLNLSASVHRMTLLPHECVLELLKLSCNVDECKPLPRDLL